MVLFSGQSELQKIENDTDRRLRSGFYWRFYFALAAARDVHSPDFSTDCLSWRVILTSSVN